MKIKDITILIRIIGIVLMMVIPIPVVVVGHATHG